MRYLEMGLAFLTISFVAATTVFSLLTLVIWRWFGPRMRSANSIFLLRMLPAVGSASLVLGVVLPAYLSFEPRDTSERAGPVVAALVVLAGAIVASGIYRILASWRETRRLERAWQMIAERSADPGIPAPAYRVRSELPFAALVGVVRPRLFVSDRFYDSLSDAERRVVVRHEMGHLLARDNLKRAAMRLAPDCLAFLPAGREIEAAWVSAAEEAADDHAAGIDEGSALDLASALLKASRFRPMRYAAVSSFCDAATIAARVSRLLTGRTARHGADRSSARHVPLAALLGVTALLAEPVRSGAYQLIEAALRLLP